MSTTLNIQGKVIEFPTSAQSPNWAEAIVAFAEAVTSALSGLAGDFDISPQILDLVSEINNNINIPLLTFPIANVRGAIVSYSFYRNSSTATEVETGTIELVYDPAAGIWQISRAGVGTDNTVIFSIQNTGQMQLSTSAMGGTYNSGALTYSAKALLQP